MLLPTREILIAALAVHDPGTVWVVVAVFGTLIVVLVALGSHQRRAGAQPVAGTARVLRRAGRACRLTGREMRVLRTLVGGGNLRQGTDLFRNRALLDGVLLRGRAALPAVLRTRHLGRLALLLSIKARVEARDEATIRSSSSLGAGTRIVVSAALCGSFESEVIAGLPDEIACRIPGDDTGVELRWRHGALVTVRVGAPATVATPVFTAVLGYGWVGGRQALLLSRAVPPAQRVQRPQRRCVLTRVIARLSVDAGEQRQRAVLLREQRSNGTLESMVAGRAAIRSTTPLRAGSLVKLEIEPGSSPRIPLYGKVVRSPRRPAGAGGVMQVQLTWLSRRHLSELYGFVEQFHAALPAAHA